MAIPPEIKDAPIPDTVDHDKIKESISKNHLAAIVAKEGNKLLEESERPNIITYAQFEPYIPLFNYDKERYDKDSGYKLEMHRLYNQYKLSLGINMYHPTIVIFSKEDPRAVYFLDRVWTRFKSDAVGTTNNRDSVPAAVNRTSNVTRDMMILDASLRDLATANSAPDSLAYFKKVRNDSALIQKLFVENNLNPELKKDLVAAVEQDKEDQAMVGTTSLDDDE